jgi:glycosyltransferase involved in cell wall biosynthesis
VNTHDIVGGAGLIAWNLHQAYRKRGLDSWMAVGWKESRDAHVLDFSDYQSRYEHMLLGIAKKFTNVNNYFYGCGRLSNILIEFAHLRHRWNKAMGFEDFNHLPSWQLIGRLPVPPDLVHCHNLHGEYFDLRTLPWLSRRYPVVVTLHDAWLLGGHCAHSFSCERWRIGCGMCPGLSIYQPLHRDSSKYNWNQKRRIYAKSRIHVASPCRWLMNKINESMLTPAIESSQVIANGVDLNVYKISSRKAIRKLIGIPENSKVLLFVAHGIKDNIWKDYPTLRSAIQQLAEKYSQSRLLFIALGDKALSENIGDAEIHFLPYIKDPHAVARYYQACDIYLHASRADTFPNTILEALACGTPVIGTAVGGIPEQVKGLGTMENLAGGRNSFPVTEATGILVSPGDTGEMAAAAMYLLDSPDICQKLGQNAASDAVRRFDLERQADAYLAWYKEILMHRQAAGGKLGQPLRSGRHSQGN